MNKLQVVLGTVALGTALVGCSNAALANRVSALENKVNALSNDVASLQSAQSEIANKSIQAYDEAGRANSRLDNLSYKYKK